MYGILFVDKYYSVISPGGQEWVVFNAAQVLPCYVIEVHEVDGKVAAPPPLASLVSGSQLKDDGAESAQEKKTWLMARVRARQRTHLHVHTHVDTHVDSGWEI